MTRPRSDARNVAVVGGGLAGLAASCALAASGFRICLFERRPYLGGRASSYQHPGTGEVVDNCQHVLLGCCTNLIDFYRRIGAEERIRWYRELTLIEPGGRRSVITPGALPAPLHSALSFLQSPSLGLRDKLGIARAMLALTRNLPDDNERPFLDWLRALRQTERAIERFWKVILVSALNEDLDCVSARYAAQVFRESFLKSPAAGALGVPRVPLSDLYQAAGDYIAGHGGEVRLRVSVDAYRGEPGGVRISTAGQELPFDYVVLAVPFSALAGMLPNGTESVPLRKMIERFHTSPITGIHFWFDRQITDLDHAVLLERTIQWMFHKSRFQVAADSERSTPGSYIELVVSSSKSLVEKSKSDILELALRELAEFFPGVNQAKVLKSTVIKELNATYSPAPGMDAFRPGNSTAWPRVFLAGDWTATGWPATMEGAVRSGYLAAEAVVRADGGAEHFLVPDLPARGFMRWFGR